MRLAALFLASVASLSLVPRDAPIILTNHLGYDAWGPKRAVIQGQGDDEIGPCHLREESSGDQVAEFPVQRAGAVSGWGDWTYWTVDFSDIRHEGTFYLECDDSGDGFVSEPFDIARSLLEHRTLSDVIYYFKGQRSSGPNDAADHALLLEDRTGRSVDAHGGWYDATGDYGKHLSHLSFSTYFNPQQIPLTVWALLDAHDLLDRRADPIASQYLKRLLDEAAWGADYLVRVKAPNGSFYRSVTAPGREKKPEDRRIARDRQAFAIKQTESDDARRAGAQSGQSGAAQVAPEDREYESSFRAGGGLAIAALARAAAMKLPGELSANYLPTAQDAWAYLTEHNRQLTNDGRENIVDDYCALMGATELFRATGDPQYRAAADRRAEALVARLATGPRHYWRADDKDRPFFHAADAGLPVVSLLTYLEIADEAAKPAVLAAVRSSLEWELTVTGEVANPFGYARQLVQTKAGVRDTRFFYPHDAETAPWWQGEDARLGSLAFAARLGARYFGGDHAFAARLERYAADQLNWILGLNPYDACLLQGSGRNNPPYRFFGSTEYTNAPGGIVNGITAGLSGEGIAFNLPHTVTGADNDWRWGEQWLPHATWYLLAAAAGVPRPPAEPATKPVVIAYLFTKTNVIDPTMIDADRLTHINYAFANIRNGVVVEGFENDAMNFAALRALRHDHPHLKILVSVGGWTWSGGFSDAVLSYASRARFVQSAIDFVRRYDLDGFDVDWEYPGQIGNGNTFRPEDKQNFTALMRELRAALAKEGRAQHRTYLLTFAAGASPSFIANTEMDKVQSYVDYVNLMTYDFREAGGGSAGHHANLFDNPADDRQRSADRAVQEFLAAGVPPQKLVLGVPFYGRAWGDVTPQSNGLYQSGTKPAERIETGYGKLSAALVDKDGFKRYWDDQAKAPYLWNPDRRIFVSYEDPESLHLKAKYVRDRGLAGAMFWQYNDDPGGDLLDALYTALHQP